MQEEQKLLILDLDETLVYATEQALERQADFAVSPYFVYKRPHVDAFLDQCLQWFAVAVWTSASPGYASEIVRNVFATPKLLQFVWASDRCTQAYDAEVGERFWIKNLKKVRQQGYSLAQTIMIDDSPEKHGRNYGNLVRVRPFMGDADDGELSLLITYLDTLRSVPNVRAMEKRHWRSEVSKS